MALFKVTILILLINGAPPILALLFPRVGNQPLDQNYRFWDNRAFFGKHKTIRGFIGGVFTGGVLGYLLGFPFSISLLAGLLSMLGDIFSSFIKRRLGLAEGANVPLLDQCFEGAFPLLLFHRMYAFPWPLTLGSLLIFSAVAQAGAILFKKISSPPQRDSLRLVRSISHFREWRACHTALSPWARYLNFENALYYRWFMKGVFKGVGVYKRGTVNALDVQLRNVYITHSDLPRSFNPFRILFISDPHLDGLDGLTERLIRLVSEVQVDACLLGGDYRMEMYGSFFKAIRRLKKLVKHIQARDGVFGILGNHDCLEITPDLEDAGICMLVNDSFSLQRNGERLWIVGVDDPHYYQCHNMEKAFRGVPHDAFSILVAHSPEIIKDSAGYPISLCLCGHTHGGQICLPIVGPVFTHSKVPRRFASGLWRHNSITGYTTIGAGCSGVPVRFNCPPEIVMITLRKQT